jgi:integrase
VREFAGWWLLHLAATKAIRPASVRRYATVCQGYLVPMLGDQPLAGLTRRDVQDWLTDLATSGPPRVTRRPAPVGLAPGTVRAAWRVLKTMLNAAAARRLVTVNVARLVEPPAVVLRPRPTPWTVPQALRFLDSARLSGDPLYPGYSLILLAGLRVSETLALAWTDLDLTAGTLTIREGPHMVAGAASVPVPVLGLPDPCLRVLRRHRASTACRATDGGALGVPPGGLVLTGPGGRRVSPQRFHKKFRARTELAGVPQVPAQSLGVTCAALLIALDVPAVTAAGIMSRRHLGPPREVRAQVTTAATEQTHTRLSAMPPGAPAGRAPGGRAPVGRAPRRPAPQPGAGRT